MICSNCGQEGTLITIDSRHTGGESIRRRRKCVICSYRFTTREFLVDNKQGDKRTLFQREADEIIEEFFERFRELVKRSPLVP